MALNYGTLRTEVLALAKRAGLTSEVVGCVRRCEGMIRRTLVGYELQATLAESDRSSAGVYTAPSSILYVQHIFTEDAQSRSYEVERVGHAGIRALKSTAQVLHYAHYETFIEFRGSPGTDQEMVVHYIGHPAAFSDDADENDLLTDHEDIYISGALFQLYSGHTEDYEAAQLQLDIFTNAIETLNETIRRKLGGGVTQPGYNLGNIATSRGY